MPETASPLPIVAAVGAVLLVAGLIIGRRRRVTE
ncbi:MAG: LPXTG cell wall anchor domain-containing protein [Actinomycetota bacterium]